MIVLGLSGSLTHDPSAALYVDGELVAAAEEERFLRDKHAKRKWPYHSARYCLETAGVPASRVDRVAFPFAPMGFWNAGRWHFARRYWYAPDRALNVLFNGNRLFRRNRRAILKLMADIGIDPDTTPFVPVPHHLAHASSAYHLSGFGGKAAVLSIDGKGEYATTLFGYAEKGRIHTIKEFYDPDSLGGVYGALTQYLGFEMLDGEFKVMGMAPYGDPQRFDFSPLIRYDARSFSVNTRLVNTVGLRRYKQDGVGYYFSPRLLEWLGPKREGDEIDDPYIDHAAAMQQLLEDVALGLIDTYLGDIIRETGLLCFAGGVALNVKLNQKIIALPHLKELFVQPAASDAGTAIGAASYVANEAGDRVEKMTHVYLGPSYTTDQCRAACEGHPEKPGWEIVADAPAKAAELLADGNPVAWFQGRMEFGPGRWATAVSWGTRASPASPIA
jgi:carbamoyltransferase